MRQNAKWSGVLVSGLIGLAASATTPGCGPSPEQTAATESREAVGLKNLGEAYRTISVVNSRPPKDLREIEQASAAAPSGMAGIDASNLIVLWGATLPDLSEEPGKVPSDKVLAYEKKVPEQGGYVLMLDRTVKKMTAEEFRSAPKAAGNASPDNQAKSRK